ncbi:MAG: UbiA family prenyltransferase [Thermoplasmata archaeon]|nr:MAG: UbiA family prenyltransferase [Thermoplasmata archaeon]
MGKIQKKLVAYIELLRPGWWPACFFIGLTPGILVIYLNSGSLGEFIQLKTVAWAFAYWASIVGIYAFNDLVGIEEDAVVNPKRPLPSGRLTKKAVLIFSLILLTIGLGIWWFTFKNPLSSLIQLTCIGLIAIYSAMYKNNLLLGLGAGLIPVGIWIAFAPFSLVTVALFLLLFFWELTLDVPENILHFEGDVKIHPQTFATLLGQEKFAKIGLIFALLTVAAVLWLFFLFDMSYIYLFFAVIGSITLLYSQLSIRKSIVPVHLGRSLGLVMFSIFMINIGIITYTIAQSYL